MNNIFEVRDDGVTIVEVKNSNDMIFLAIGIFNSMKNMPELETLVVSLMAKKVTPDDLGVSTIVNRIPKGVDADQFLRKIKGREPAKDADVPDFVKRSLKGST